MVIAWKHPFTAIIAGPSGSCGKTVFVSRFLKHLQYMVDQPIGEVIWCFSEWQTAYERVEHPRVRFNQGLLGLEDFPPHPVARLLIIDDLMRESDDRVVDLFTKGSHHRNLSILYLSQNIFHQSKGSRDVSLNCHYMVCYKSPRDSSQVAYLSRQVFPKYPKLVQEAYYDSTSKPHGYLLLNFKQSTPDEYRVTTDIFPDDSHHYAYVPKSYKNEDVTPSQFSHNSVASWNAT
ncbi:hypothetical protein FOCC_FOCC012271 [Frankliniella occidentalis]|nr:hypothetical protein FOCC_FOCC012271 [Frankliniella occidentalis]